MEPKEILEGYVRRRGYRFLQVDPAERLFLPSPLDTYTLELYLGLLRRYSFRLVLRDVIYAQDGITPERLARFAGPAVAAKYLDLLHRLGMVEPAEAGTFRIRAASPPSFGDTFEWWVCQILSRELQVPACYGVKLAGTHAGGDFDVLAVLEGKLLFVETKISPPKHVHLANVAAYLEKWLELGPDYSLFIEDTHLRLKDKIVPLFERALIERGIELRPRRAEGDIFALGRRSFILNSRRDLVQNLTFCFKSWLRRPFRSRAFPD